MSWIRIDRKVDLLSLVAFVFGFIGAMPQIKGWVQGSDLLLLPPPQIEFSHKDRALLLVNANMAYVNHGSREFGSIITEERMDFVMEDLVNNKPAQKYTFHWQAFMKTKEVTSLNDSKSTVEGEFRDADAHPFIVHGGDGAAHQTSFAARQIPCNSPSCTDRNRNFYYWKSFEKLMEQEDTATTIDFVFVAQYDDAKEKSQVCRVVFDQQVKKWITKDLIPNNEIILLPCFNLKSS